MADGFITLTPALANDERFKVLSQLAVEAYQIDLSMTLVYLVDIVDASVLPYLAEQFSLMGDGWELASTESAQRRMIKDAIPIHQYKGTIWSIKRIFYLLGFGEIEIDEGRSGRRRDGKTRRDGFTIRGDRSAHWAEYRIRCFAPLNAQQVALAKRMLANVAPARCLLVDISSPVARNGRVKRDGKHRRGGFVSFVDIV